MNPLRTYAWLPVGLTLVVHGLPHHPALAAPLGTAFTYQGSLTKEDLPAQGTCDFRFRLFAALAGGTEVAGPASALFVPVSNGTFATTIDFGAAVFTGDQRYLDIEVRCPASAGDYVHLAPRQLLTATPYALHATSAARLACDGCVSSSELEAGAVGSNAIAPGSIMQQHLGFSVGTVQSVAAGSGLTGGIITDSGTIAADFGTTAGTVAEGDHAHDAAYWKLGGNTGTVPGLNYLGTADNQSFELRVGSQRALRLEPGDSPNVLGGYSNNGTLNGATGVTIAGGGHGGFANRVSGDFGTVGGGEDNWAGDDSGLAPTAAHATVSGGSGNHAGGLGSVVGGGSGNSGGAAYTVTSGGLSNSAGGSYAGIGGGRSNETQSPYATVGGGYGNRVRGAYGTIAGGGRTVADDAASANLVTDDYATIGGGGDNVAGSDNPDPLDAIGATVGGGGTNSATAAHATVCGGGTNTAGAAGATVAGGYENFATGIGATVGGGVANIASGVFATVPGGSGNAAQAAYSFAAGRRALAYNQGCVVVTDSTDADESCINDNRFVFRVTNAFYIWTKADHTAGVLLPTGGAAWSALSDRNVKENFAPVDRQEVLERLAAVPIETWNLKSQADSIRHIGPMAQDFSAAFGVGEDDTHINSADADGVALAAIQGLYEILREKDAQIAALTARLEALESTSARQR